ncbi:MAG TPA: Na+/H+ antiporter NhaA [Gemmataceae bacterium]|nr:Na+/H+ antiporter NhaA [Gemmataceae bacterium]
MAQPARPTSSPVADKLPVAPVHVLTRPLARFLAIESAGGVVLLLCALAALVLANSPAADAYQHFWHTRVSLEIGTFALGGELGHFVVNDVLMTVFFFVVGLEIKRELVAGELREWQKAALPVVAAAGGMIVPAGIYMALRWGQPDFRGWGVPMATDIAFVVGVMALLGKRAPFGLKIMLLSLAIADDIGAVLVIAVFYSSGLDWLMLGMAAYGLGVIYILKRIGVRSILIYVFVGAYVWLAVYKTGVHPTVAGVVIGLMTPSAAWVRRDALRLALVDLLGQFRESEADEVEDHDLQLLSFAARESVCPLERLETVLHPWVGFVIMPVFALANAGVEIEARTVADPVAVAVALGLLVGKPVGIVLFSWLAVRAGVARLPDGVNWLTLLGGGCLAGIGFTMSLFVAELAFAGSEGHLSAAKIGILIGSALSAVVGAAVLIVQKKPHDDRG